MKHFFSVAAVFSILFFCTLNKTNAQSKYWVYGGALGVTGYAGDLSTFPNPVDYRVGAKLFAKYKMKSYLLWRTDIDYGWYQGVGRIQDNLPEYKTEIHMINAATGFEYNFLQFREDKRHKDSFTPYFFLQLGVGTFLNKVSNPATGASYSDTAIAVTMPVGMGFKKRISTYLDIGMEFSITKPLWTDKTDGVYKSTESVAGLFVDESWRDNYYFLGVTLSYHLIRVNCPKTPRYQ
ncbi:DUF6089 family protein [Flammeovirga kamogawensis]|uniref:DUF6089 domain-containing protein n=1 Tax=Flammeovirga kamogawensis TaxID=373891 RepID=A0ABX8GUC0_9BACT|nr:DUF6089 family protein [Flammeovirga kamogawensis]MBB6459956.1 hypothetical protein [Flammeovirga kamogawensis]QWG06993.1 hypothetical protein KM029_17080 [Flammeovirga kamogawensis]TRX68814.1 hypothetical protein EO216_12065 [Flammeovirga kamogawensis]